MTTDTRRETTEVIEGFLTDKVIKEDKNGRQYTIFEVKRSVDQEHGLKISWFPGKGEDDQPPPLKKGSRYQITFLQTPAPKQGFYRNFKAYMLVEGEAGTHVPATPKAQGSPQAPAVAPTPYDVADARKQRSIASSVALEYATAYVTRLKLTDRSVEKILEVADQFYPWLMAKADGAPVTAKVDAAVADLPFSDPPPKEPEPMFPLFPDAPKAARVTIANATQRSSDAWREIGWTTEEFNADMLKVTTKPSWDKLNDQQKIAYTERLEALAVEKKRRG